MPEIVFTPGGCRRLGGWMYGPGDHNIPHEGWKLHISGKSNNAQQILNAVWKTLVDLRVAFKFAETTEDIDNQTGEQWGKWLVVYPKNLLNAFICVCMIDEALLKAIHAGRLSSTTRVPLIRGERRVGQTCIFTRYGGFQNDLVLGPGGQKRWSPRGVLKPDWIRDPWHLYDPKGNLKIAEMNSFQPWPEHPASFRRG